MASVPEHYFTYGGKTSKSFNVWISGGGTFDAPRRDVETVSVPGRNGDLTFDNGRFENREVSYPAFIPRDFTAKMRAFRAYMCSVTGYARLEDTYDENHYCMARFEAPFSPDTTPLNKGGDFTVTFSCKPQRFLKTGETAVTFTSSGNLTNPTLYEALPLIRAYGTGNFTIGSTVFYIRSAGTYTDIDCDLKDAYRGTVNCNANVSTDFPVLKPGANRVLMSGITKLEITPRWYEI